MLSSASDNGNLKRALITYVTASSTQQQSWNKNYNQALTKATVIHHRVIVPPGTYGPVAVMMNDELRMAKSGLLSGALDRETNNGVYRWNVQNDLLFLQGAPFIKLQNLGIFLASNGESIMMKRLTRVPGG